MQRRTYEGYLHRKKRKKLPLFILFFLVASLLFFRDQLASQLLSSYIGFLCKTKGKEFFSFDHKSIEHGRLKIEGLKVKSPALDFKISELNVYCQVSLVPFKIQAHIHALSPEIYLTGQKNDHKKLVFPAWLLPQKCIKPVLEIEDGSLNIADTMQDSFAFTFQQEDKEGCIGHLSVKEKDTEGSICEAFFFHDAHDLVISSQVKITDVSTLHPLISLHPELQKIQSTSGALQGAMDVVVSKEAKIKKIAASIDASHFSLEGEGISAHLSSCSASMQYPATEVVSEKNAPLWRNILAKASFEDLDLKGAFLSELQVKNAKGSFSFPLNEEPSLSIEMDLSSGISVMPAHLTSSGSLHSDGRFWLDSELILGEKSADASLHVSLCRLEHSQHVVSMEVRELDSKMINLLLSSGILPNDFVVSAEKMSGRSLAWFEEGHLCKLEMSDMLLSKLSLIAEKKDCIIKADAVSASALFCKEGPTLHLKECKLDLQEGSFSQKHTEFSKANLHMQYLGGILAESTLSMKAGEGSFSLKASGPLSDVQIDMDGSIPCNSLLSFFSLEKEVIFPHEATLSAKLSGSYKDGKILLGTDAILASEGELPSILAIELEMPLVFKGFIPQKLSFSQLKARLFGKRISSFAYTPFLSHLPIESTAMGDIAIDAELYHGKVKGSFWSDDLFWQTNTVAISLGQVTKGSAGFFYDFFTKKHSAFIDLSDAFFAEQSLELSFNGIAGRLVFEDHRMKAESLTAQFEGITIPFSLYYDVEGLFIETKKIEGSLQQLSNASFMRKHLGSFADKVAADFILPEGGCNLFLRKGQNDWLLHYKLASSLSSVDIALPNDMHLQGMCDLSYDSSTSVASVKKTSATLTFGKNSYDLSLDDFVFDPRNPSPFHLSLTHQGCQVLSLCGSIASTHQLVVSFDGQKTSFFSMPLAINKMTFDSNFALSELDVECVIDQNMRLAALDHIVHFPQISEVAAQNAFEPCRSLEGDLAMRCSYLSCSGVSLDITSKSLCAKGRELKDVSLHAEGKGDSWNLDHLRFDDKELSATFLLKEGKISVKNLKFKDQKISLLSSATLDLSTKEIKVENSSLLFSLDVFGMPLSDYAGHLAASFAGTLCISDTMDVERVEGRVLIEGRVKKTGPLYSAPYRIYMEKESPLSFSTSQGFTVLAPSWKAVEEPSKKNLMTFSAGQISLSTLCDKVCASNLSFEMAQEGTAALAAILPSLKSVLYMKKDAAWKVRGDTSFSLGSLEARLSLASGEYKMGSSEYNLVDPLVQISSTGLHLHSKVKGKKTTLFCDLQKDFSIDAPVYILLRSSLEVEGLKILCMQNGDDIEPVRFEGKLLGLDLSLQKSQHIKDGSFFGVIKINCNEAAPILPEAIQDIVSALKLGRGLKVQGHFFLPSRDDEPFGFRGDITGESCDFVGYILDSLQIKASISPDKVLLEDIKIDDIAGSLAIKTCQIDKDPHSGKWSLFIPLGHIKELRPSLLKEGESRSSEKPLLIKNLSVYDMQGMIGDKKSFIANGALQFSNSAKKEFSLLDIPFEMIKDLGLDLGILSPVAGEADFMLKKGRCVFHQLKNSYSEGRRSEFFLAPDTMAYIDLDGNWNVDLKMKQHVLLKWSESLLVSIRGTLAKPKYSLKNVDAP